MTPWHWIALFGIVVAGVTSVSVAEQFKVEAKSPAVTCIEQRGNWKPGWGRTGWDGTCNFDKTKNGI